MKCSRQCDGSPELERRSRSFWSSPGSAYRLLCTETLQHGAEPLQPHRTALHGPSWCLESERPMLGGGGVHEVCLVDQISSRCLSLPLCLPPTMRESSKGAPLSSQAVSVVAAFKNEERRSSRSLTGDFLCKHDMICHVLRVVALRRGRPATAGRHSSGIRGVSR